MRFEPDNIVHAYRHLYRGLLKAVRYSSPARYIVRDQLREAFRETRQTSSPGLDVEGVKRTLWFLTAAARERGLEHRILKNLIEVRRRARWAVKPWKKVLNESKRKHDPMKEHQHTAMQHYDMTVAMLNKSMGLCLR